MTFSDFALAPQLQASVRHAGFDQPTPIQKEAIPPALEGRDILASAETGSGKTAAFLLPIMNRLLPMQRGATRALVLAPTRELAAQIVEHFRLLAQGTSLTCAAVHGGVAMGAQERAFRKGVDALVACPGRLLDHMRNSYAELSSIELLVIDEADRMLDMGFLPDVRRVLAGVPKNRQTYFFSATLPPAIVELSREMLHDPARLNIDRKPAPARRHHALRVRGFFPEQGEALPRAAGQSDFRQRPGVHTHQAQGEPAGGFPRQERRSLRPDPWQPEPVAADSRACGVQAGEVPGPRGHRHCRARHRRGGPRIRGQLRRAQPARGLHPQGRPHGSREADRGRLHPRLSRGREEPQRNRARPGTSPSPAEG